MDEKYNNNRNLFFYNTINDKNPSYKNQNNTLYIVIENSHLEMIELIQYYLL